MSRINWPWVATIPLAFCGGAMLLAPAGWPTLVAAQEETEREERAEEDREEEVRLEALERRLDEIEELIEHAEQRGDAGRVRELRREGERLLDRLEQIERARSDVDDDEERSEEQEEWERHARELEIHRLELEVERLRQELDAARQESAVRLAHIAESHVESVSYAISQAIDEVDEEAAIDFLTEMKEETNNEIVLRILRHHLASLYRHADRPAAARQELRALILGQ